MIQEATNLKIPTSHNTSRCTENFILQQLVNKEDKTPRMQQLQQQQNCITKS